MAQRVVAGAPVTGDPGTIPRGMHAHRGYVGRITPRRLVVAGVVFLAVVWALVIAIDLLDLAGLRTALASRSELPLWAHLFQQNGPVEWAQWSLLAATTVLASRLGGAVTTPGNLSEVRFWGLFGIGTALMLIEDAGDPRHALVGYAESAGLSSTLVELVYFAALGSVLVVAFLRDGRAPLADRLVRRLLILGVVTYVIATVSSGTRHLGEWYEAVGHRIMATPIGERLLPYELQGVNTGYWLLDFNFQESLELLGALGFCAASLAAVRSGRMRMRGEDPAAPLR